MSVKKAYTSRAFDIETKELAKHSQSGSEFFGIHVSNNGKVMIFAGGIPLKRDGKVVGVIGASLDKQTIMDTKRLVNVASLPPDIEIESGWDACVASMARPATQQRIKTLIERGSCKPGDAENRLGDFVGR
jgi:hypothetical protein